MRTEFNMLVHTYILIILEATGHRAFLKINLKTAPHHSY